MAANVRCLQAWKVVVGRESDWRLVMDRVATWLSTPWLWSVTCMHVGAEEQPQGVGAIVLVEDVRVESELFMVLDREPLCHVTCVQRYLESTLYSVYSSGS